MNTTSGHPGDGCVEFCQLDGGNSSCAGEWDGFELESMPGGVQARPVRRADGSAAVDIVVTEAGGDAAALFRMDPTQARTVISNLEGCLQEAEES